MIPTDPDLIKKMEELAERNIVNGDWGDETTIPGLPGGTTPMTPEERAAKILVSKTGSSRVPKHK